MTDLISIILPVYNVELYLRKSLDSLLNQTYANIEIIAINDGSTDSSYEILLSYSKKDSRIKIINQTNKGLSEARNIGLYHSKGNYILFVDSDDYIENTTCENLYNRINKLNSDFIVFGIYRNYPVLEIKQSFNFSLDIYYDINQFIFESVRKSRMFSYAWNKFYKKSFLVNNNIQFTKNILYEDLLFYFECILKSKNIGIDPGCYYHYVQRSNSITKTFNKKDIDVLITVEKLEKMIIDNNRTEILELPEFKIKIYDWICSNIFHKHIINIYSNSLSKNLFDCVVNNKTFKKYIIFCSTHTSVGIKRNIHAYLLCNHTKLFKLIIWIWIKFKKNNIYD